MEENNHEQDDYNNLNDEIRNPDETYNDILLNDDDNIDPSNRLDDEMQKAIEESKKIYYQQLCDNSTIFNFEDNNNSSMNDNLLKVLNQSREEYFNQLTEDVIQESINAEEEKLKEFMKIERVVSLENFTKVIQRLVYTNNELKKMIDNVLNDYLEQGNNMMVIKKIRKIMA